MRFLAAIAGAVAFAGAASAAPPGAGVLVPGRSLGGIALGTTKAALERSWGRAYGVCKGCRRETWYFNYYAFQPRGAGVEFRAGKVAAIFTLYQPAGWRTNRGFSSATTRRALPPSTAHSSDASAAATPSSHFPVATRQLRSTS